MKKKVTKTSKTSRLKIKPTAPPESTKTPATSGGFKTHEEARAFMKQARLQHYQDSLAKGEIKHPLRLNPKAPHSRKVYQAAKRVSFTLATGRVIYLEALWQSYVGYGWTSDGYGSADVLMAQKDHDISTGIAEKAFGSWPIYCLETQLRPRAKGSASVFLPPIMFIAHFRSDNIYRTNGMDEKWVSNLTVVWYGDEFFPDLKALEKRLKKLPWNEHAREWDSLAFWLG